MNTYAPRDAGLAGFRDIVRKIAGYAAMTVGAPLPQDRKKLTAAEAQEAFDLQAFTPGYLQPWEKPVRVDPRRAKATSLEHAKAMAFREFEAQKARTDPALVADWERRKAEAAPYLPGGALDPDRPPEPTPGAVATLPATTPAPVFSAGVPGWLPLAGLAAVAALVLMGGRR